jgi:hypothetical protein
MDDALTAESLPNVPRVPVEVDRRPWSSCSGLLYAAALFAMTCNMSGCSLFVMAGKMFYGDPKVISPFHSGTGIEVAKDEQTVLIIFSAPESVKSEFPSIEFDLTEETIRRLKRREIKVIDPDDVATFIDDNGGYWHDEQDLADHFDADIIVHVDLDTFTCTEENSPWLLRGRAEGNLYAYRVRKIDGEKVASEIFVREITSTYPKQTSISTDSFSRSTFQKQYIDLMATYITQMLHDHRASELVQ